MNMNLEEANQAAIAAMLAQDEIEAPGPDELLVVDGASLERHLALFIQQREEGETEEKTLSSPLARYFWSA